MHGRVMRSDRARFRAYPVVMARKHVGPARPHAPGVAVCASFASIGLKQDAASLVGTGGPLELHRSGSGSATGRYSKPSLILQGRARLWSAHYCDKLKRHFERGIGVGDSEQLVRAAALASPAPGHGVEAALVRVTRLVHDADGHPVHDLRL